MDTWMTLAEASADVSILGDRCPQCDSQPLAVACRVDGPVPLDPCDRDASLPVLRLRLDCPRGHAWEPRHHLRIRVAR